MYDLTVAPGPPGVVANENVNGDGCSFLGRLARDFDLRAIGPMGREAVY